MGNDALHQLTDEVMQRKYDTYDGNIRRRITEKIKRLSLDRKIRIHVICNAFANEDFL